MIFTVCISSFFAEERMPIHWSHYPLPGHLSSICIPPSVWLGHSSAQRRTHTKTAQYYPHITAIKLSIPVYTVILLSAGLWCFFPASWLWMWLCAELCTSNLPKKKDNISIARNKPLYHWFVLAIWASMMQFSCPDADKENHECEIGLKKTLAGDNSIGSYQSCSSAAVWLEAIRERTKPTAGF